MEKMKKTAACIVLMALFLTGCGETWVPGEVEKSMLSVEKDGRVTEYLVEDFGKSYYNISELTSMAVEEAAQYNTVNQSGNNVPVKVDKVEALADGSNRVAIVYRYDSPDSYMAFKAMFGGTVVNAETNDSPDSQTAFNGGSLFYGTVGEAALKGYSTGVILKSVKDGTLFTEEQLKQATDKRLLIAPAGLYVYCPGTVEYISDSAVIAEDGSVDTTQAQDSVYILLK